MKIRIIKKNRLIKESSNTTTARYRQTQPRATGEITHVSEEIQQSRIEIGLNIDRFLQRPFVTVGEEIMDDDEELRIITDPKETNLLLYLYRGIDPSGKLMNGENIAAVNRELKQRVNHFLMGLSQFDKKVLASDIDFIIQNMSEERSSEQTPSHQSSRMLKSAPGHFDDYVFGTRRRSIYKDTRAGKDFMLKKTPELKNIPEQHHFLFSMENLMGRVKQALGEQPEGEIPSLDPVSYDANYRLGDFTEEIEVERAQFTSDSDSAKTSKLLSSALDSIFIAAYEESDSSLIRGLNEQEQINLLEPYLILLIQKTIQNMHEGKKPDNFLRLIEISDNIPEYYLDKYEESFNSIFDGLEQLGML
jgi:hypothetical protein